MVQETLFNIDVINNTIFDMNKELFNINDKDPESFFLKVSEYIYENTGGRMSNICDYNVGRNTLFLKGKERKYMLKYMITLKFDNVYYQIYRKNAVSM